MDESPKEKPTPEERSSSEGSIEGSSPDKPSMSELSMREMGAAPGDQPDGPAVESAAEVSSEPSRAGKFARRALRWVTAVVVIFGLGLAATWLVRVRPLMAEVDDLGQQLDEAVVEQNQLQQRVDQLEGVEARNQELEDALLGARGHLDLLGVLVDVTSAQLAIAEENTAAAKIALEHTGDKLDALAEKLADQDVDGIRERLALVLDGLDNDIFAAQRDLEILSNTLVAMERQLFGAEN